MTGPRLTAEQYAEAQQQLVWLASIVLNLPLDQMLADIAHAEAVGPIVDPTLWIRGHEKLEQVRELAEAVLQVQRVARRHLGAEIAR